MRKLHMALLGVFVTGVLLGGIGTGIAFGEYSGITYGGKVWLGEENMAVKELDYAFTPSTEERIVLVPCYQAEESGNSLLVEDTSIPVGVVRYRVTYNEKRVHPRLNFWDEEVKQEQWEADWEAARERETEAGRSISAQEEPESEAAAKEPDGQEREEEGAAFVREEEEEVIKPTGKRTYLELGCRYRGDDFDTVMENKDRIMNDLKQKQIYSYEIVNIKSVEILVNPASMLYLDDHSGWD